MKLPKTGTKVTFTGFKGMDADLIENQNQRNEGMNISTEGVTLTAGGRLSIADGDCAKAKAEIHWAMTHGKPWIRSATIQGRQVMLYTGSWKRIAIYDVKATRIKIEVELVWDATKQN